MAGGAIESAESTSDMAAVRRMPRIVSARPNRVNGDGLRDGQGRAVDAFVLADHQLVSVILLLADVFEQLDARAPPEVHGRGPWLRVRAGVFDRQVVAHRHRVGTRE